MNLESFTNLLKSKEFAIATLASLGDDLTTYIGLKFNDIFSVRELSPMKFKTPLDSTGVLEYDILSAGLSNIVMAAVAAPLIMNKMEQYAKEHPFIEKILSSKYVKPIKKRVNSSGSLFMYLYAGSKCAVTLSNLYVLMANIK